MHIFAFSAYENDVFPLKEEKDHKTKISIKLTNIFRMEITDIQLKISTCTFFCKMIYDMILT